MVSRSILIGYIQERIVNSIDDNDDDDGEYVELTDDEVKKYFGH